jgi:hypothetical protein
LGRSIFLVAVEHLTLLRESKRSAFVIPAHPQSSPEFLVRDVQVPLRLHDARVSEHQLDDANIDAVG